MKIAQIMLAKGFGGAERSFVDISESLVERGHEVIAICEARGKARHMIESARITTITVRGHWDPIARMAIKRVLHEEKPEIVHAHLARAAKIGGRVAKRLNIPCLVKTHNYVDLKYYRDVSQIVPTTRDQERYLLSQGLPRELITRIPNFTAMELISAAPAFDPAQKLHLVAIGRLVAKKGFDLLITAFKDLLNETDAELTLVGDGELKADLQQLVIDQGIRDKVIFHGWSDNVRMLLDTADLFVLPSLDEPFGIVCLEAMARGVPIVATNTQGPLEILDNDTAYLVDKNSPSALLSGIIEAVRNPYEAHRRANNALRVCRQSYSKSVVLDKYLALYSRLVDATR